MEDNELLDKVKFPLVLIPQNSSYCYTWKEGSNKRVRCPFFKRVEGGAFCEFLQLSSFNYELPFLLWDEVKECGISESEYNESHDDPNL